MERRDDPNADTAVLAPGTEATRGDDDPVANEPERIGRYVVLGRLGAGGMGIVYAARDEELDRKLAIKLLRTRGDSSREGAARLKREAQALAKLSHPHVVHVYEVGQHEGQVYLAMELVQGRSLRSWQLGDRSWREVVAMYVAAGRGLACAHAAGIVHRDFKPDNVLVGADGRPRVLDFGLARPDHATGSTAPPLAGAIGAPELTEAGTVLGTPAYMPPEQLDGLDIDARCDQYAFCVSLFEALYGTRPFAGKTFAELSANVARGAPTAVDPSRRGVPREIHTAIVVGLAADPRARHRDLGSLLAKLERYSQRRRDVSRIVAGLVTATALATTAFMLWPSSDAPREPAPDAHATTDDVAAILAASELPAELTTPLPHDPLGVTAHRLANGLTVYLVPRRDQAMVRVSFAVRIGAYDEPPDRPGVHHIAAHMLDAGSRRLGTRDAAAEAELLRQRDVLLAELEAIDDPQERLQSILALEQLENEAAPLTIADERSAVLREAGAQRIRYHQDAGLVLGVDMPAPALDLLLAVEADRMRNPSFRGYLAETNRLLAEARMVEGGSRADEQRTWELLAPSIGSYATPAREAAYAATLPFSAVKAAFARRFAPNNVAIVMVGDVEASTAVAAVEAAFGDWAPVQLPARPHADARIAGGRVFETVAGKGGPRATIAFPLPPALRDDRRAVLLLADMLEHAVPDPDGPLPSVATLTATLRANVLVIVATADRHALLDDVEAEIVGVLESAAANRLDPGQLGEAIARRELRFARLSTVESDIAAAIADAYVERRSWSATAMELASPAIGDAPLAVAARALLDHGRAVVYRTDGRYQAPSIPSLPLHAVASRGSGRSAFAAELLADERSRIEPQFLLSGRHYVREDAAGITLVTARTDPPLFRAGVRWPVGVAHDWWVCDAIGARVADVARTLRRGGVALDVDCGRNATAVRLEGPQSRFEHAWALLLPRLAEASLTDEDVHAHADGVLARRARARRDPERAFDSLVELATWEEGGGIEHARPTDDAIEHVNRTLLEASLHGLFETSPAVMYAGPDPDAIGDRLPPAGTREPPLPREWRARRPTTPLVFIVDVGSGASAVLTVSIAPPADGSELAMIYGQLLQARFVERFREASGWGRMQDIAERLHAVGDASFVARAYVANDRVPATTKMALALMTGEPTQDAFAPALRAVEESLRADRVPAHLIPERVMAWASPGDPRMTTWERLGNAELGELQAYARAAAEVAPVIAIGAELAAIDLDALRELGTVTVVDVSALCLDE